MVVPLFYLSPQQVFEHSEIHPHPVLAQPGKAPLGPNAPGVTV
jgi:hypothetical protein